MFDAWCTSAGWVLLLALAAAPLLPGLVNKVKAFVAGRQGPPLLQLYWDIFKLLRKGVVRSRSSTAVFRLAPCACLAALSLALALLPMGGRALVSFPGDMLLLVYLLALSRFLMMAAALDTGSSFCGMGASREAWFSCMAEPTLVLGLGCLSAGTGGLSLSDCLCSLGSGGVGGGLLPVLTLLSVAFMVVFLVENCRVPFDDPNTHLELTMIHEAMVLDNGGPDLGFVLYTASLKFWLLGALVVQTIVPATGSDRLRDGLVFLCGMLALSVVVGLVESAMARVRLSHVPRTLAGAFALTVIALLFTWR